MFLNVWSIFLLHLLFAASNAKPVSSLASPSTHHNNKSTLLSGGLLNLGNTCYLNAQLECAYHIPCIRNLIINPPSPIEEESDEDSYKNNIGLESLQQVFSSMIQASEAGQGNPAITPAVSTSIFCRTFGINPYEQQDSQEFWKLLLPELDLSQMTELYRGSQESYITALDGTQREKKRIEPFLDLSLDVSNFDAVYDSLDDMFTNAELLSEKEGNGWRPEKGSEKVDALKGNLLNSSGLPNILQLHLMRFRFNWETETMSKINDRFSFSKVLNLGEICNDLEKQQGSDSTIYDLQSVVVHAGEYGRGHYYAYVRPNIRSNQWYRFDDNRVAEVSFKEVKEDAFGGSSKSSAKKKSLLKRIFGSPSRFGWGGKNSSAYMLQYVKRSDIPMLYDD